MAGSPASAAGVTYDRRVKNRPATSCRLVMTPREAAIGGAAWCAVGHRSRSWRASGPLLDRRRNQARRQEPPARALVVLGCTRAEPAIVDAGAVRVGERHEDRARQRHEAKRDLLGDGAEPFQGPRRLRS